jgi:hypothetical protein
MGRGQRASYERQKKKKKKHEICVDIKVKLSCKR